MQVNKNKIDVSQCWLVYMSFIGDVEKTAAVTQLAPAVIQQLAKDEGWDEKIRRVSLLAKGGKPGDWERAQNRALCYVQAHRLRMTFDTMLEKVFGMDADQLISFLSTRTAMGRETVSARFLADLTAAVEKTHHLSYAALGDTVKEREARIGEGGDEAGANQIHAAVMAALNNPKATFVPSDALVEEVTRKMETVNPPETDCPSERKCLDDGAEPPRVDPA